MPRTKFEELEVYRLSEKLADEIWGVVLKWPRFAQDTVGKQIVRAADSVGANIAEGDGRGTYVENRRFSRVARGSLQETQHWLRRAYQRQLLTSNQVCKLRPLVDLLGPKLNAYIRSMNRLVEKTKSKEQRA